MEYYVPYLLLNPIVNLKYEKKNTYTRKTYMDVHKELLFK